MKNILCPQAPGVIGLGFGKNSISAIRLLRNKNGYCLTQFAEETLPFPLFTNLPTQIEECIKLTEAMQRLAEKMPQAYWPLQIALPDPAVISQIYEFDSLPQTLHERTELAKFRLKKEFPAMVQMECVTQVISTAGKPGLLLAQFIHRAWLNCLNNACRAAGFYPYVIASKMNYLFNRFHDAIQTTINDGVLISVEADTWSILFWDSVHRPRFVRSRWRDMSAGKDEEYDAITHDIERLIKSYVMQVFERRVGNIFISANDKDRFSLAERLDKRMKISCILLDGMENYSVEANLHMPLISPGMLAAAEPRI